MDVQKCELEGVDGESGYESVGPPGCVFHCEPLEGSYLGSKSEVDSFAREFLRLQGAVP